VRRKSELSPAEKEGLLDQALRRASVGWIKEWATALLKSDKASSHLPLWTILQVRPNEYEEEQQEEDGGDRYLR
jgi:hypothetical protein